MSETMSIYCAINCNTEVTRRVKILHGIAGSIPCLECEGRGVWDYMEPEIAAGPCVQCKGTGTQLVSI